MVGDKDRRDTFEKTRVLFEEVRDQQEEQIESNQSISLKMTLRKKTMSKTLASCMVKCCWPDKEQEERNMTDDKLTEYIQ